MRKEYSREEKLSYQQALAAALYNTYLIPLTDLYDSSRQSLIVKRWYASNILGALYAIALGHYKFEHAIPLDLNLYGTGIYDPYPTSPSALRKVLNSPIGCLRTLLLTKKHETEFNNLVSLGFSLQSESKEEAHKSKLSELVHYIVKLDSIYIEPDEKKGDRPVNVNVKNIRCLDAFIDEYKIEKSKGPWKLGLLPKIAEIGPFGLFKKALSTPMSVALKTPFAKNDLHINTLADVQEYVTKRPNSSTIKVLNKLNYIGENSMAFFNLGGIQLDEFMDENPGDTHRKTHQPLLENYTRLPSVLTNLIVEYSYEMPNMDQVEPAINFTSRLCKIV